MRLIRLEMVNFKQYRNAVIDFRDGLTGIIGSNGAGKSTIFDAIRCSLYGAIPFTKEHLRSDEASAKDTVRICLIFEAEEIAYRVVREFRGTQLSPAAALYIDAENKLIASQQNPVTSAVTEILGISYDAFLHSVFSGQKELGRISDAKGAERRELVRQMIGMARIDAVQQSIRRDMNDLVSQLKGLSASALSDEAAAKMESEQKELQSLLVSKKEELEKITAELDASASMYAAAETVFTARQKSFTAFTAHTSAMEKSLHAAGLAQKTAAELAAELAALKNDLPLLDRYKAVPAARDALKKELEQHIRNKTADIALQEKKNRIVQMEKEQSVLAAEIDNIEKAIHVSENAVLPFKETSTLLSSKETELGDADVQLKNLSAREGHILSRRDERANSLKAISALGAEADCPLCLRPLADSYDAVITRLAGEIQQLESNELSSISTEKNSAEKARTSTADEIQKLRADIEKMSADAARLDQQKKQLSEKKDLLSGKNIELDDLKKTVSAAASQMYDASAHEKASAALESAEKDYAVYLSLKERTARIPDIENRIKSLLGQESQHRANAQQEEQLRNAAGYSEKEHKEAQNALSAAVVQRDGMQKKKDVLLQQFHEWEKKAERINTEIARHKEQAVLMKKLSAEKENLARLVALFDGFKNAVLAKVQPSLSAHASALFALTTGGRYESIHVDENFDFHITDRGKSYPLGRFSGGETDLANLCLRIAVSKTIRDLAGGSMTGFLGFDEIFGSQDAQRRHMVMDALNRLSDQYQQIFIVSHIEDIRDDFPQLIEVSRSSDGSVLRYRD